VFCRWVWRFRLSLVQRRGPRTGDGQEKVQAKTTLATVCEPLLRSQGPCCQASVNQLRGTVSFVIAASVAADQNNTKPAKVELLFTNLVLQHFNYRVVPHHQLPFQSRALRMHRDKDSQASTRRPHPQFALSRFQKCTPNGRPSLACIFVGADPPAINPPAAAAGFGGMVRRAGLALTSRA
jgi:hypothetical protein